MKKQKVKIPKTTEKKLFTGSKLRAHTRILNYTPVGLVKEIPDDISIKFSCKQQNAPHACAPPFKLPTKKKACKKKITHFFPSLTRRGITELRGNDRGKISANKPVHSRKRRRPFY